jgi:uncharacterized protein YeaO (DUF488 family)
MTARIPASNIAIRRVYDKQLQDGRTRVLVDRLWPRGVSKRDAAIDHWFKDIAPSDDLRRWFDHDPARWEAFCRRYRLELAAQAPLLKRLRAMARAAPLALVYGARNDANNNAVALRRILLGRPIA